MPNYNILDGNNNVVNTISADDAFMQSQFPEGNYELVPEAPEPPAPPAVRRITKLAFRNRFTAQEKVVIEIAGLDDPSAAMQVRAQAAAIRVNQADVSSATFIDLDRADTRAGVQALEAGGILSAGRAARILDDPIQSHEEYRS